MNSKTPKKSYGRTPERTGNGASNSRYAKKETVGRPRSGRPRRDDDAPARPRYRKNDDEQRPSRFSRSSADKPYRSRLRRDDDVPARPRYRKNDDEQRPSRFSRSSADKPYRSRDDASDKKPGYKRSGGRDFDKSKRTYAGKPKPEKTVKAVEESPNTTTRLNKYIANSGICSRREADEYITAGLVSVNGQVITELGVKVMPGDDVRFNGERLKGEMKVYVLLNKPKDFVTTTDDPHASKTVMDLIGDKCPQRIFPVGRLDKNTTGVLLLTNDGALCEQLTHPSYNKKKIYQVSLNRNVKVADLRKLVDGIELEDGLAQVEEIAYVDGVKSDVGLEIHSGRNRVVRRMFEALNYQVKALDRVYFAGLTKKNLKRGQWRFLSEKEINALRMGAYE
ncbi:MAG: rRNA pseudouridine synthase [Prevotellaceae bacterium]|nr:rRNA pseudouridine synthase [Prevotellaceae bacterium]